jgi:hypothetical protein
MAVSTKKTLKTLEAERALAAKQAKADLSALVDAEARLAAAKVRAAQGAVMIAQATGERFSHLRGTMNLTTKGLEKKMLLKKPHPFLKVSRARPIVDHRGLYVDRTCRGGDNTGQSGWISRNACRSDSILRCRRRIQTSRRVGVDSLRANSRAPFDDRTRVSRAVPDPGLLA